MIVLSGKGIAKSYGIHEVLKDVTFNINEGDKVGLIGANGEGKSTLFKILIKELSADSGEIYQDKGYSTGYLSQRLDLESENVIYDEMLEVFNDLIALENKIQALEEKMSMPYTEENKAFHEKVLKDYTISQELYSHRGGYTFRGEISRVLKGLGFQEKDYNSYIKNLSGGQKTRVALCKLLLKKPELLLLDEPTNHLDLNAIEWLEEYLRNYKGTVLLISHDRYFLDSITNRTFELINGHINCYNVNYSKYIELKKQNYEVQLKAYNLQQSEIRRQEQIIERFRSFNREKSIKAAESREKALEKMEKISAPDAEAKASRIQFHSEIKSGNDVLWAENLKKSYGDKLLFENVSMDIKKGNKIALIGENGRGKTTLFKIILGKVKADEGALTLGRNVITGYYDQEQSDLDEDKEIINEVWDAFPKLTTTEIRNALASFLFTGDSVFKKIELLSGGEKCRINLLKLMLSKSNFLLLDEPTNHLDIMSREALEDAILNYDGTLLIISHDRYFLNKVVDKIFELEQEGIKTYLGNYNYYVDKKKNPNRYEGVEEDKSGKTKTQIQEEKRKKREAEREAKAIAEKIKKLEADISHTESEISKLNAMLCLEEVYSDPQKAQETQQTISHLQNILEKLYSEWEEYI
ncbi:ribosomal protection-like ABC-F family protein [Clostridium polynesiense]|uniref:ribosomal protection-like ABC-F family protein n=1 Tax=Clostridium polynesiense TaxID=1325933 RepID=UPI00058F327E|nr:ATP-binding cassette domain-containing protein [Clostridium polynesiense]